MKEAARRVWVVVRTILTGLAFITFIFVLNLIAHSIEEGDRLMWDWVVAQTRSNNIFFWAISSGILLIGVLVNVAATVIDWIHSIVSAWRNDK